MKKKVNGGLFVRGLVCEITAGFLTAGGGEDVAGEELSNKR